MLSAVILSERGYPAVPLVGQLVHQRFVRPGPLVLGTGFTFLPADEIAELKEATATRPHERIAQRRAARGLTMLVHSEAATITVEHASQALFGRGELSRLDEPTLVAALRETSVAELKHGAPDGIVDLLVVSGLSPSKGAARPTIAEGGISVNNTRIDSETGCRPRGTVGGVDEVLVPGVGARHLRVQPEIAAAGGLPELRAVRRRHQRNGQRVHARAQLLTNQPHPRDDVAPLVRASDLQCAAVALEQFDVVVGLQQHVR